MPESVTPGAEAVSTASTAATALIEAAAERRGLAVRRLGDDLILCLGESRWAAFQGLAGPSVGQVARRLCRSGAALRRHLSAHGVAVSRPANARTSDVVTHAAVVGTRVVAVDPLDSGEHPELADVAVRAVRTVPGVAYATVELVVRASESGRSVAVRGVDPLLSRWPTTRYGPGVADAVLAYEQLQD